MPINEIELICYFLTPELNNQDDSDISKKMKNPMIFISFT